MRQGVSTPLRVLEFFAGVGGFRGGLEGFPQSGCEGSNDFEVVWSNQYEPSTKRQHASEVYVQRWGSKGHTNEDINNVLADPAKFEGIVNAQASVLVGGFPCQDYSVAKSANSAAGIEGKKGVLWWSIHETLHRLAVAGQPIRHLILENVDRLIKSPTKNRGRDFAIILSSLAQLGYAVEWRVVNAADYGYPQRRRRIFIVAHHETSDAYATLVGGMSAADGETPDISRLGVLSTALPWTATGQVSTFQLACSPLEVQAEYACQKNGSTRFQAAGVMVKGAVTTVGAKAESSANASEPRMLGDVVRSTDIATVPSQYFLPEEDIVKWQLHKGSKSAMRTSKSGHSYKYSEGAMPFPDPLDRPGRTIITAEGGPSPSRFKHVVESSDGRLRRLIPDELEEMNGFPRGFTSMQGVSDTKRAFFMGNALVVGLVERIGFALRKACL